jgi:hypothetical protein
LASGIVYIFDNPGAYSCAFIRFTASAARV